MSLSQDTAFRRAFIFGHSRCILEALSRAYGQEKGPWNERIETGTYCDHLILVGYFRRHLLLSVVLCTRLKEAQMGLLMAQEGCLR